MATRRTGQLPTLRMSITFWCPDAPTTPARPFDDEPDYVVQESVLPELNLSNQNAHALLDLLQIPFDHAGEIPVSAFEGLTRKITEVLDQPVARAPFLEPVTVNGAPVTDAMDLAAHLRLQFGNRPGPRVIDAGRTDDYLVQRARQLLVLVDAAKKENYPIVWG